jgi:hypothetical protein
MRTTQEVFEDHLQKRLNGDLEADIQENFSPDVILLTGTGTFHGHRGVRQSAAELEKYLGGAKFAYTTKIVEGGYAFLEWRGRNGSKHVKDGADSFVIKDGKIVMQTIHYSVDHE